MGLVLEHEGRRFHRQAIVRPEEFVPPFAGEPYPCLLWVHGAPLSPDERRALAERVLDSGCRYVVCAGSDSGAVHDEIDHVYIWPFMELIPEAMNRPHVMTTWHAGEPSAEVAEFFVMNTNFEGHVFRDYLVLHVGGTARAHEALDAAVVQVARGLDAI